MKETAIKTIILTTSATTGLSFIDYVEPTLRIISLAISIYVSIAIYRRKTNNGNEKGE